MQDNMMMVLPCTLLCPATIHYISEISGDFFCSRFRPDSVVAVFAGVAVGKSQRRLYYLGRDQRRIQGYLLPLSYCYLPFFSVCYLFMCHFPCLSSPLYVSFGLSVFISLCVICLVCFHFFKCHLPCLFSPLYV